MNLRLVRLLSLFVVMFTMFSMSAIASNYYSKTTAKAVGAGKVYVCYKNPANQPEYASESTAINDGDGKVQSAPTHTYYLYAQADEGNVFIGWFENEACTGSAVSNEANYTVSFTVNSTDSNDPTTKVFYAKFQDASAPMLGYTEARVYANLSSGTYKNETLTTQNIVDAITYESSNVKVATVAADGTVTLLKSGSCYIKAKSGETEASYVLTVVNDAAAGVTQIGNGDFEDWRSVTSSNHAPDNWNSFETAEGSLASMTSAQQVQMVEGGRPGSDGIYCVDIWSRSVLGVVAQGNLTTGCINAGGMTATDKNNYNFSKTEDPLKSETLSKVPVAIRFWAKFVPAAVNADHPNAHMEAVVHDNFNYITYGDPSNESDEEKTHVIAKARYDFPTTNGEWVEFTAPFVKTGNTANGQLHIIVNLATNADPGQGQTDDHLYIDDVELLYDEATAVMTDANYATFCAPFEVNVPNGFMAFTVQGVNQNASLAMTAVEGPIPANTPVILAGGGQAMTFTVYGTAVPATPQFGLLTGVYEDTAAPVGSYVLQNIDGVVGMYKVAEGQQPTVKANRAYLTVPGSDVKAFFFNTDDATGINAIDNEQLTIDNSIYNVAGQRIDNSQFTIHNSQLKRGIYIVNGKKILK